MIVTIEFAIPLRSETIITIIVNELLRTGTCRCVLIRAWSTDALCCDSYDWWKEILSDGDHDLSHDLTATVILTAPTDHWPLSFLDFCRVNTMAEVQNNENVAFEILMYAFICQWWHPSKSFKITTKFKDRNYRCLLFCCKSQSETHWSCPMYIRPWYIVQIVRVRDKSITGPIYSYLLASALIRSCAIRVTSWAMGPDKSWQIVTDRWRSQHISTERDVCLLQHWSRS